MKRWVKITTITVSGVVVIGLSALGVFAFTHSGIGIDRNHLPQFIQAGYIDLSKIYSISKFRSAEGHDFSANGETCRSMKHYFMPQFDPDQDTYMHQHNGIPKPPDGSDNDIAIYSPVDGTIVELEEEHTPIGKQVHIVPDNAPSFKIRLMHIFVKDGLAAGAHVKAGQRIGSAAKGQATDIAVQIGLLPWQEEYLSYFQVMPDSLFAEYQKRGAGSRDDFIISKAYRDAHPVPCEGKPTEKFNYPPGYDFNADEMHLSGYIPRETGGPGQAGPQHMGSQPGPGASP